MNLVVPVDIDIIAQSYGCFIWIRAFIHIAYAQRGNSCQSPNAPVRWHISQDVHLRAFSIMLALKS